MRLCALTAVVVVLAAQGCASTPVRRVGSHLTGDPSWPRGEGRRIAYVGEVTVPESLGIERSVWTRLWEFFAGEAESPALYRPVAVALASDGRLAVADPGRRVVRLYEPSGNRSFVASEGLKYPVAVIFIGATLLVGDAETGEVRAFDSQGQSTRAALSLPKVGRPAGFALDLQRERLFIVDVGAHCVHVVPLDGRPATVLGHRGSALGEFNFPVAAAVDASGRLFVSDAMNFRVEVFEADLTPLRAFGGLGDAPGHVSKPKGIAVDREGVVYLVEGFFDVVQAFDAEGQLLGVLGGSGSAAGRFWLPGGLGIDSANRLFVADTWNERVQVFELDRRSP